MLKLISLKLILPELMTEYRWTP